VKVGPDLTFNGPVISQPPWDAFVAKVAFVFLDSTGATTPGGTVQFDLTATEDAGRGYRLGSSFGTGPIALGNRTIGLDADGLLWISLSGLVPDVFQGYAGAIGADGHAAAALALPPLPATVGLRIHTAFVTLDPAAPSGVRSISSTRSFTIAAP